MKPLAKEIAVLAVGLLIPGRMMSQGQTILLQDYTSKISVVSDDGKTVCQQIGAPLTLPWLMDGPITFRQGLLGYFLSGSGNMSGVGQTVFKEDGNISLEYSAPFSTLSVAFPEDYGECKFAVTDAAGSIILSGTLDTPRSSIDASSFSSGVYVAVVASKNNNYKSLKFSVK